MTTTDIIIIGSGPGGYRAAVHAARHGLQVTIFEESHAGGTCLNCGCIPTKTLLRNAEVIDTLRKSERFGITGLSYEVDFTQVMARKRQVVETLRSGVETLLSQPGITLVKGKAHMTSSHVVECCGEEYTAPNIIIATGSQPKMLPIPGINDSKVVTSTELLEVETPPSSLCIVGAGVIGMEFASVFSSLGSKVTVVEYLKECLPAIDSDIAKRLRQTIARRGVDFVMQAAVKEITDAGVVYERKGKTAVVEADMVLMATGREARTAGLGLEAAGIATGRQGIITDEHMQTNVEGVYAIGDVNGRSMLAHSATMQGIHAVNRIVGIDDDIQLDIMPAAIFTHPEAASVGASEDICKEKGIDYTCRKGFHRSNGKALAMDETEGMVKLLCDSDGHIIGCHSFGAHSADMVQEVAALIAMGATISQLRDITHIHPTIGEILQDIAF